MGDGAPRAALRSERLDETAKRADGGLTWFTRPELLHASQRPRYPKGYFNLGLAHGVPGVIALSGLAFAAGVERKKARAMLDGAVDWLEAQRLPSGSRSMYPSIVGPSITPEPSRSAWCYGDPGVAAALLVAARGTKNRRLERRPVEIALQAARLPPGESRVVDAAICHGSSGLGHLFNRMFQTTGQPELGKAARYWIRRALEMRRPGRGIVGFQAFGPGRNGKLEWTDERGFLTGAAGIALVLLAATTPLEPSWDRVLLIS